MSRSTPRLFVGVGAGLVVLMVGSAIFAPLIARHDPNATTGLPFDSPSLAHPLGTTDIGQDIFAQLLYGGRTSIKIAFIAATVATIFGLIVGLVSGYRGGWRDALLMRLVDLMLCFPFLPFVIVLTAFFGRGLPTTIGVIAIVLWARPARVLRAQVTKLTEHGHVVAAQAMGGSDAHILSRHIVPRLLPMIVSQFVRAANLSVVLESSLAFLGLGNPSRMSWGTMLYFASNRSAMLTGSWRWWILPPGLALTFLIVGLALVGYWLEIRADPRLGSIRRSPKFDVSGPRARSEFGAVAVDDPASEAVLDVRGLTVAYESADRGVGMVRALDRVDLRVRRGSIVGVVGESGSGKTTLAMTIAGLARWPAWVERGDVRIDGRVVIEAGVQDGRRDLGIGFVPQFAMNGLNPSYTIFRQVTEAAELTMDAPEARRRATHLLERVGLEVGRHRAFPHQLSGGMRQRVVIAMALVNRPSLIVADEPLSGLDVTTQVSVLQLFRELRDEFGVAILLISHDLASVKDASDEMVVMYAGRVVEIAPSCGVGGSQSHPYSQALVSAFPDIDSDRSILRAIAGDAPDLSRLPPGCAFYPRCVEAEARCCESVPPLVQGAHSAVACLRRVPT